MKIKLIKVRLSEKFNYNDKKILNQFLSENNILKYESAFVEDEDSYELLPNLAHSASVPIASEFLLTKNPSWLRS